jgi:hypothetical protein
MCDDCVKLQKQIGHANNYNVVVLDELGKLCKVAGIKSKNVAKLDAIAVVKEVTASYKKVLDSAIEKAVTDHEEGECAAKIAALPEAWQESFDWIEQTEYEPADIDRLTELLELIGFTPHRLQFVLTSADMAHALQRC